MKLSKLWVHRSEFKKWCSHISLGNFNFEISNAIDEWWPSFKVAAETENDQRVRASFQVQFRHYSQNGYTPAYPQGSQMAYQHVARSPQDVVNSLVGPGSAREQSESSSSLRKGGSLSNRNHDQPWSSRRAIGTSPHNRPATGQPPSLELTAQALNILAGGCACHTSPSTSPRHAMFGVQTVQEAPRSRADPSADSKVVSGRQSPSTGGRTFSQPCVAAAPGLNRSAAQLGRSGSIAQKPGISSSTPGGSIQTAAAGSTAQVGCGGSQRRNLTIGSAEIETASPRRFNSTINSAAASQVTQVGSSYTGTASGQSPGGSAKLQPAVSIGQPPPCHFGNPQSSWQSSSRNSEPLLAGTGLYSSQLKQAQQSQQQRQPTQQQQQQTSTSFAQARQQATPINSMMPASASSGFQAQGPDRGRGTDMRSLQPPFTAQPTSGSLGAAQAAARGAASCGTRRTVPTSMQGAGEPMKPTRSVGGAPPPPVRPHAAQCLGMGQAGTPCSMSSQQAMYLRERSSSPAGLGNGYPNFGTSVTRQPAVMTQSFVHR